MFIDQTTYSHRIQIYYLILKQGTALLVYYLRVAVALHGKGPGVLDLLKPGGAQLFGLLFRALEELVEGEEHRDQTRSHCIVAQRDYIHLIILYGNCQFETRHSLLPHSSITIRPTFSTSCSSSPLSIAHI